MVFRAIVRDQPIEKWVQVENRENQRRKEHSRKEDLGYEPRTQVNVDAGEETHRAFDPSEIPIRLRAGKDGGRIVGSIDPDGIDLNKTAKSCDECEDK